MGFFCRPVRAVQQDAEEKPSDFTSGVYYPELLRTMGSAFDAAWEAFKTPPKNADFARLLMASAIIEA
jgi:hypothetical protein